MKTHRPSKRSKTRQRQKTGAPPLSFPFDQILGVSGLRTIVRQTRKERNPFRRNTTDRVSRRVFLGLVELAARVMSPRPYSIGSENATESLVAMAIAAARFLEDFAHSDLIEEQKSIEFAAMQKNVWPVLLGLGSKRTGVKGEVEQTLEGAAKAKEYLCKLRLGQNVPAAKTALGSRDASVFSMVAELVLIRLVRWREQGVPMQIAEGTPTEWAKSLFRLELPLTTRNVDAWWRVAKIWLDEQWDTNRKLFEPLIKHLKLDNRAFRPSDVRGRVIDDSIKKAFKALAIPADS